MKVVVMEVGELHCLRVKLPTYHIPTNVWWWVGPIYIYFENLFCRKCRPGIVRQRLLTTIQQLTCGGGGGVKRSSLGYLNICRATGRGRSYNLCIIYILNIAK